MINFATRAIYETLKTRVKLNLNFTRPHAITYTSENYENTFGQINMPKNGASTIDKSPFSIPNS